MSDGVVITPFQVLYFEEHEWEWLEFVDQHSDEPASVLIRKRMTAWLAIDEETRAEYARQYHPPEPRVWRGWRPDALALLRFLDTGLWLPHRTRQVMELCIRKRLSINACAEQLGIGRESVRTHLRRGREMARLHRAMPSERELEPLQWEIGPTGCEKGRTPPPMLDPRPDPPDQSDGP